LKDQTADSHSIYQILPITNLTSLVKLIHYFMPIAEILLKILSKVCTPFYAYCWSSVGSYHNNNITSNCLINIVPQMHGIDIWAAYLWWWIFRWLI